jgi:hypothetical protein
VFQNREHFGPVSEARIAAAEQTLGVRFPSSYRAFLGEFGAAWLLPPVEIAGLPSEPADGHSPLFSDVVGLNIRSRGASRGQRPRANIQIADDGTDYIFYLDTSTIDESGECCVCVLGPGRNDVTVAKSFIEFAEKVASSGVKAVLR